MQCNKNNQRELDALCLISNRVDTYEYIVVVVWIIEHDNILEGIEAIGLGRIIIESVSKR